jgi:hypothetical protein
MCWFLVVVGFTPTLIAVVSHFLGFVVSASMGGAIGAALARK